MSWRSDELEARCVRESHHPAEGAFGTLIEWEIRWVGDKMWYRKPPPGRSSSRERERHNADGHKSGGQYIAVLFGLQLPLTRKPLQQSERYIFFKEVFARLYSLRQYVFCMYMCIYAYLSHEYATTDGVFCRPRWLDHYTSLLPGINIGNQMFPSYLSHDPTHSAWICSQKYNQLLKNDWPLIKDIDYVTNTFDHQVYTNKKLWLILKH